MIGADLTRPYIVFRVANNTNVGDLSGTLPRVELRESGVSPTRGLSLVYYNASGNTTFHNLLNQNGRFLPDYELIKSIFTVSLNVSPAIENLAIASATATFSSVSGVSRYIAVPIACNFGVFTALSVSGTTVSATFRNISGGTHTITGTCMVIALR